MKKECASHIHWPTLWHFCSQEVWALSLLGSFFSGLMFISGFIHFAFSRGVLTFPTLVCLFLSIAAITALVITISLLSRVYYVELLDIKSVSVDAHIIDKRYAGQSLKLLSDQEIKELLNKYVENSPDLYQIVYRYRYNGREYVKTHSLIYDEIFNDLHITQRIPIFVLPCRSDVAKIDESALLKQYREHMVNHWYDSEENSVLSEFKKKS